MSVRKMFCLDTVSIVFVFTCILPMITYGNSEDGNPTKQFKDEYCCMIQRCLYKNDPHEFCKHYKKHCCNLCQAISKDEQSCKNQVTSVLDLWLCRFQDGGPWEDAFRYC